MPKPNSEPQREFFKARARFVAYGGARGGGKSWAARNKAALLCLNYPGIRGLLLRRTFAELRENHIRPLRTMLNDVAVWKESEKAFEFVTGSLLKCGYCDSEGDVLQYQGQEYDFIIMEEATQFTEYQFSVLTACMRGVNDFPKRFYLTCNPGGVGHAWVKRLFISREYQGAERPEDYAFIAARVYDNKDLLEKDPDYVKMLENLPPDLRRAWLDGDWDMFVGQFFTEWRRSLHVVQPFVIPSHWRRYFTMDYGLDMLAGYWIAMDETGCAWVYRELYEGRDNYKGTQGGGLTMGEAAARVRELTMGEEMECYYAPPDMWNRRQDTGRSVADAFAEAGLPLVAARNDRVQGWLDLKEWLRDAPETGPRLKVFDNCVNLIESMPNLVYDRHNPSDCAKEPHKHTHAPDALRYFCAGRPLPADAVVSVVWDDEDTPDFDRQVADFLEYGM
jgi:phage terminase large subunit